MKRKVLNVILLNLTVFFALISMHEISHVVIGNCMGCEQGRAIIFDAKSSTGITGMLLSEPYAEIVCSSEISQILLFVGSFLVTSFFGSLFLLFSQRPLSLCP